MKKRVRIIIVVLFLIIAVFAIVMLVTGCGISNEVAMSQGQDSGMMENARAEMVPRTESAGPQWLELPAVTAPQSRNIRTHYAPMQGRVQRNYTLLYDSQTYTSYWVAYPLCHSHMSRGREEIWAYDPSFPETSQTRVAKGYGASQPTANYPKNFYARGHQLPNADRNAVTEMQRQTYYSTNITPQLQNGFNAGVWKDLEEAVRGVVPRGDTLYVVTGASFRKGDESPEVKEIKNRNDGKMVPVPNYYWKALLKVKRQDGILTSAETIGFWFPHKDLKGADYSAYAVSVDQIEEWTGHDMFAGLPENKETMAESNTDWLAFKIY